MIAVETRHELSLRFSHNIHPGNSTTQLAGFYDAETGHRQNGFHFFSIRKLVHRPIQISVCALMLRESFPAKWQDAVEIKPIQIAPEKSLRHAKF